MNKGKTAEILRRLMDEDSQVQGNENALHRRTGVPQPTIHRILSGETSEPRTSTLQRLADYFGVSVATLQGTDETSNGNKEQRNTWPPTGLSSDETSMLECYRALAPDDRSRVRVIITALHTAFHTHNPLIRR